MIIWLEGHKTCYWLSIAERKTVTYAIALLGCVFAATPSPPPPDPSAGLSLLFLYSHGKCNKLLSVYNRVVDIIWTLPSLWIKCQSPSIKFLFLCLAWVNTCFMLLLSADMLKTPMLEFQ